MKISENTKVKIRVPKHLYEAVQAEMEKKHQMEEQDASGVNVQLNLRFKDGDDQENFEDTYGLQRNKSNYVTATVSDVNDLVDMVKTLVGVHGFDDLSLTGTQGEGPSLEEGEDHEMNEASLVSDPNFIAGLATLLGVGGSLAASIVKDLRKAKSPEDKKKALQQASSAIQSKMTGNMEEGEDEMEEAMDIETLMEAIKDAKKKKEEDKKKKEAEAKKKKMAEAKKKEAAAKKK